MLRKELVGGLYFYPLASSRALVNSFDRDALIDDATTGFPTIAEMSGIVVTIYWAQLCAREQECDFGMIDRIVSFWARAGKHIILNLAPIGSPLSSGKDRFVPATPQWVLDKSRSYMSSSNNFIGAYAEWKDKVNSLSYKFEFPRYDDLYYVGALEDLVRRLGQRYDGNPSISFVRIAVGKAGEDNPYGRFNAFGPDTGGMADFTNDIWVSYVSRIVDAYLQAFRHTRLEFDVGWTTAISAGATPFPLVTRDESDRARTLVEHMIRKGVYFAFNGIAPPPLRRAPGANSLSPLDSVCVGYDQHPSTSTNAVSASAYGFLDSLANRGIRFGMEGNSLNDPCQNPARLGEIIGSYRPSRLIFFGDAAAVVNFARSGLNSNNEREVIALGKTLSVSGGDREAEFRTIAGFAEELARLWTAR